MSIGRELGKDGSGGNLPVPVGQLTAMRPHEIDKSMEDWLAPSVVTSMRSTMYLGPDSGRIGTILAWTLEGAPPEADARAALEVLQILMEPADPQAVQVEISKMRALTVSRNENEDGQSFLLAAFGEQIEIEAYPLDVVKAACREVISGLKFWPSWAEYKERADSEFLKRKHFYLELRKYLAEAPL